MMSISKRTVKRLRTVESKLTKKAAYFDYYAFIGRNYGVDSTLDLTEAQAEEAISILDEELSKLKKKGYDRKRPGMITPAQKEYAEGLFAELGWDRGPRWTGFIEKQTGKKASLDMLTNREASKVITGLEKLRVDGRQKETS
nr:hypothetical protein 2 [Balneolaceae bacterium]